MAARPPARGRRRHDYSGHRSGAAGAPSVTPPPLAPTSGGRSRRRAMASISPQALSSHVAGEPPPEIHDRDCRAERVAQRDEGPSVVPGRRRPGVIRPAPLREWFPSHATPAPKFGGIAAASSSARTRCRSFDGGRARLGGACPALAEPRRRSGRSAAPGTGAVRSSRLRRPGRSPGAPVRFAMVGAWAWSSWIRVVRPARLPRGRGRHEPQPRHTTVDHGWIRRTTTHAAQGSEPTARTFPFGICWQRSRARARRA
jgi:hypothetical protein